MTEGAGRWERVGGNTKGLEEIWGGHHYLDYGYGFMDVYMSKQKYIYSMCVVYCMSTRPQ